jgi:hypothetical protein
MRLAVLFGVLLLSATLYCLLLGLLFFVSQKIDELEAKLADGRGCECKTVPFLEIPNLIAHEKQSPQSVSGSPGSGLSRSP